MARLANDLAPLKTKLPPELQHGADALTIDDPGWLRKVLLDVRPLLLSRLSTQVSIRERP